MSNDLENERVDLSTEALDAILDDARRMTSAPSPELMARILADAADVSSGFETIAPPPVRASTGLRGLLGRIFSPESGVGPIALCAASVAIGVWLGASAPDDVATSAGEMITAMGAEMILMDGAVGMDLSEFDVAMIDEDEF